jgi:hypothetical protein
MSDHDAGSNEFTHYVPSPEDRVSTLEQVVSTALTSPVVAPDAPAADHTARLGVIETVLATVSNDMKHILSTRTSTKDSQP